MDDRLERMHELLDDLEKHKQSKARKNLIDFASYIDPEVAQFYRADHLMLIASKLQAVEHGEIDRLIISTPPRHWKSSLASEKFPIWYLGKHPKNAVILTSHTASLALTFSQTVRDTIHKNSRCHFVFPDVSLEKDSKAVEDWKLDGAFRSSFRAAGVLGSITGQGANLIVIDDPVKDYAQAQSQTYRDNLWNWYKTVLRTRLEPGGAIVLIMTRWHDEDLAGKLIHEMKGMGEKWEVLNLPAINEKGKALWEARWSKKALFQIRDTLGGESSPSWRCLFQGSPTEESGDLIKKEWFTYIPELPEEAEWWVRYWDMAITEKQTQKDDPDFTASCVGAVYNQHLYLGRPIIFRKTFPDTVTDMMTMRMEETDLRHGTGKSLHETAAVQSLIMKGFYFESIEEKGDKVTRAQPFINQAKVGRVILVGTEEEWAAFVNWWWKFPNGAHDDPVDVVSGISNMMNLQFDPSDIQEDGSYDPYAFIEASRK